MVINPIVGVYIPIIRIPIKGGMTIPNIATFDHGTYVPYRYIAVQPSGRLVLVVSWGEEQCEIFGRDWGVKKAMWATKKTLVGCFI